MAEGEAISHPDPEQTASLTPPPAGETPTTKVETIGAPPVVESPTITPPVAEAAPIPIVEPKMPPAAQLGETAAPPTFLREHATRTIAGKTQVRVKQKAPPLKPERVARETPRQTKFALLAASVALCGCLGAALGAAGVIGLSRVGTAARAPRAAPETAQIQALREEFAQLKTELTAAKTGIDHLAKTTGAQFGKIVERFDRAERAQADPAAKLAKITETIDRLEKKVAALPAAPAPIAAATPAATPATAPAPLAPPDVTGSITPRQVEAKAPPKPQILEGFFLRRVYDGIAVVEGRMGVMELEPGAPLPGGGRVEEIKRQDGHWVVVTTRGLIVSARERL
jgi:F0F1-type ATP synthase membrane subunit c/vacuolar-type H+-ATPase subunit K